jgi:SAM-dependent methyltransferase
MVTSVRDLERRAPHAEKGLEHLLARVQQLEERLAPPNLSQQDAGGDPGADRSIERMFVHSRIPRPPSRVLTLDDGATGVAMELAAFGFDVWVSDDGPNQDEHPKLRRYRPVLGALPFAEATFDVVVSMSSSARRVQKDPAYVEKDPACVEKDPAYGAEVAELVRVLKPGGRFIVTCSAGDHGSDPGTIASMLAPLRVTEMLRATRNDGVWSVAAADVVEPQRVKREAIALVVAERPEAETLSGPGA